MSQTDFLGFAGKGPGEQTRDGCSVELYAALQDASDLAPALATLQPGERVLELGCGAGRHTRALLAAGLQVTAVDDSAAMLAHLPVDVRGLRAVCASIETLQLNERYDAVLLASGLIHHPSLGQAFLAAARRHLRAGGRLLLQRHPDAFLREVQPGPRQASPGLAAMQVLRAHREGDLLRLRLAYRHADGRRWEHVALMRCFSAAELAQWAADAGLAAPQSLDERWLRLDTAPPCLNISSYRFVPLPDAAALRERLAEHAQALGLKGTVLLAEEGINLFLAGPAEAVNAWLDKLRQDPRFAGLEVKESWSDTQPFKRLKLKVKREIIRMDQPLDLGPDGRGRAPALEAATLKRWLDQGHDDEGRPIKMLDTRNGFEVDHGAFENAVDWRITKFTEFPAALAAHREELAGHTVVSYCTGGIRCEKAAWLLADQLQTPVYQLEGGILKYFEQVGGAHYRGDCFVFDEREALDPGLRPHPSPDGESSHASP